MPANDRPPSTQFYWRDWLSDSAVQGMSFDEQGRYMRVLAMTHQTDTPGVCTEEEVRGWAQLSSEEWPAHREAFARAFRIRLDGTWIQRRTVEDRKAQRRRFEQSQAGGRRSATRPRDLRGRLAPRLDAYLGVRPGAHSSSSPSSPSKLKNPTPRLPPRVATRATTAPLPESTAGDSHANWTTGKRANGLESVGDLVKRTMPRLGTADGQTEIAGFTDKFLKRMRARYPQIDLYVVAAWVREEVSAGRANNPEGLFVWRCRQLLAASKAEADAQC